MINRNVDPFLTLHAKIVGNNLSATPSHMKVNRNAPSVDHSPVTREERSHAAIILACLGIKPISSIAAQDAEIDGC